MERNADECLNITLNHKKLFPAIPVQRSTSRLSLAVNNAPHVGNTIHHTAQISPLRRKMWIFQFLSQMGLVFHEDTPANLIKTCKIEMRTFAFMTLRRPRHWYRQISFEVCQAVLETRCHKQYSGATEHNLTANQA